MLGVMAWPAFKTRLANPYTWLLYTHIQRLGVSVAEFTPARAITTRSDIFHLHWPEFFLNQPGPRGLIKTLVLLSIIDWTRYKGTKVVWTIHNLHPHESSHPQLEKWFYHALIRRLDGVVHLSMVGRQLAEAVLPHSTALPAVVTPIGHYRHAYPRTISREDARQRLAVHQPATMLLFFGSIRPYKGLELLIPAFAATQCKDVVLYIVGRSKTAQYLEHLRHLASRDGRIRIVGSFVPPEDVQIYLAAADLVVLPFTEILNSSSAILALSFDRPVLVPNLGALSELRDRVGSDWVITFDGPITSAIIDNALTRVAGRNPELPAPVEQFDWETIARMTTDFYVEVCARRRDTAPPFASPLHRA